MRSMPLVLACVACASAPVPEAPAPLSEWPSEARAGLDLLRELIATDASRRSGREAALDRLFRFLDGGGLEVNRREGALVARLGGAPEAVPLLLVAHVDAWPADPRAWPEGAGPTSAAVVGGELYGRGVLGGKGAAALFAAAMVELARDARSRGASATDRARAPWLVVTSSGLATAAPELERAFAAHGRLADSGLVLGPGGFVLDSGDGAKLNLIAAGQRGQAKFALTAVGPRAPLVLAEAVRDLPAALPSPQVADAAMRYLDDRAKTARWPDRWMMRAGPLTRMVFAGPLSGVPWTAPLVAPDLRIEFEGNEAPIRLAAEGRARAWVQVLLPDGQDPLDVWARFRARLPRVHVDLLEADAPLVSGAGPEQLVAALPAGAAWARTMADPSQLRWLIEQKLPVVGFVPIEVSPEQLRAAAKAGERASLESLRRAFVEFPRLLGRLLDAPLANRRETE